jgi:proteasome assembly chaperone (PAC2) family protein
MFSFFGLRMQVALGGSNNGEENGDQKVVAAAAQKPVIEKVHVSSVILAAHSDYFMRLFSNGMIESNSESATVQVTEKGEDL